MATNLGMIQVSGTTYRIVAAAERHEVFRLYDDRKVGTFVHRLSLHVVESEIGTDALMEVAQAALRAGRLDWQRVSRPRFPRVNALRALAEVVFALWPIG